MTARIMGPAVPASGDAMTLHPLTEIGQPNYTQASQLAETRLWGSDAHTFTPYRTRHLVAVGISDSEGAMISDHTLYGVKVYEYVPHEPVQS